MMVVSHRIGGITFRTESDAWLPRLEEEPFERFRVGDDDAPGVRHRIHRVALDSLTLDPPMEGERERLLRGTHVESGALDSPLLRSPAVRAWLRAGLDRPEQIRLWLYQDRVIGHDFSQRVFDFFYAEEYGQGHEDEEPEERSHARNDGEPEARFRIRKVDLDPQTAAPLTAEERERLAWGINFSPPEILDMPLLRVPAVRAWLHAGLERSEKIEVCIYLDGVMVWNLAQNTLDFFYIPEFGDTPEGRVAVYFPRMFSTFLPQFAAILVHSSGVIRDGRAALFLAPDEGGKTTVLRHATEGLLLNDDQIILQREGDDFIAHATPLGRMTSGPCQARLGAFFVLEKARVFELEPVKLANLVRHLWEEHLIYTSVLPKPLKLRAFDLFYDVCHQMPAYKMRFPKDYVDWDAIDAAMVG
jgi:hypothetical protein